MDEQYERDRLFRESESRRIPRSDDDGLIVKFCGYALPVVGGILSFGLVMLFILAAIAALVLFLRRVCFGQ